MNQTGDSSQTDGKTVILAVTGSIAAVRTVELARELGRRGFRVHAVMSRAAQGIIHSDALEFATGNRVITELTGEVEHVRLGNADLLLIAPCTANTIGKMANGICDTPVTAIASVALGRGIPVLAAPAMHEPMYANPVTIANIARLKEIGVIFIEPVLKEGAAKIAPNEVIVLNAERSLGTGSLKGKKILLTSGSTTEPIDPIRILTTRASGLTGRELALEAFRRGADVAVVHKETIGLPGIREIYAETSSRMLDAVLAELETGYDLLISAAAISDFNVRRAEKKIKSDKSLKLELTPARKLIHEVRSAYPGLNVIGFKAETGVSEKELIENARKLLRRDGLCAVVANDVERGGMGTPDNNVYIVTESQARNVKGAKSEIARYIMDMAEVVLK